MACGCSPLWSAGDAESATAAGREAAERYPDDVTPQACLALAYFIEDRFVEGPSPPSTALSPSEAKSLDFSTSAPEPC